MEKTPNTLTHDILCTLIENRKEIVVNKFTRITFDPNVMGGKPTIRGMRVTVGTIVGLVASGHTVAQILELYPYLESEDITEALSYAAWRSEEIDVPLAI